jgi:hypothetical protein
MARNLKLSTFETNCLFYKAERRVGYFNDDFKRLGHQIFEVHNAGLRKRIYQASRRVLKTLGLANDDGLPDYRKIGWQRCARAHWRI